MGKINLLRGLPSGVQSLNFCLFKTFCGKSALGDGLNSSRFLSLAQSNTSVERASEKQKKKLIKKSFVIPSLSPDYFNEIFSITGISIGHCHVTWLKFAFQPYLSIVDWNAKVLPDNFRTKATEPDILKYAYSVKNTLPASDLYVMETFSIWGKDMNERISELHLSSMLIVLLNGLSMEPDSRDKVVFQKKSVINHLYGLLIGSERVSCRVVAENLLEEIQSQQEEKEKLQFPFSVRISPKCLETYEESPLEKKEDMSIALLLILSFIDVNIVKTESTLDKIHRRKVRSAAG